MKSSEFPSLNETHDPALRSWVESANSAGHDFPLQNLPFGVFSRRGANEPFRGGVAIGDWIIDLGAVAARGVFDGDAQEAACAASASTLNGLMALGPGKWSTLRRALSRVLRDTPRDHATRSIFQACLIPQADAIHAMPAEIGDYTDFYTSIYHATNVGRLFRPDNPLLPNYKWVPIGYHGRASTIGVSGQGFARPYGQTLTAGEQSPAVGPSQRLDYELELGIYIGPPNKTGAPIKIGDAESHVFGICLLNDWSARDIQSWEYQPLGPFLSKNFASTVSPWIVTLEALAPYRGSWRRPVGDPEPLDYLDTPFNRVAGAFDIQLEALIETASMRAAGEPLDRLALTSFRHSYWTIAQLIAHHTINGCALRPGDLLGSGTQSGPGAEEAGSLLELTAGGKHPLILKNGEIRTFLEDGDTVVFRGFCEKSGAARIGFGECRGTVLRANGWA